MPQLWILRNSNQPQPTTRCKRSLLPFLGTALSWLTGTATTKDIRSIRTRINQLIATQSAQRNTLVHIVSILNVTRYATQVNRHSINTLIDAVHSAAQDIDNLFSVTLSLASSINFNQITLYLTSVFANLQDTLKYLHTISMHTMDYIDAATTGKLSPHVLPVTNLQQMLQHIATTLPPTLHLPTSPMDTLHFYRYLRAHVLIKNKQFLLLIDIPIQDRARQITIQQVLTLDIPHGNYSAHYDINTQYFGVTSDATMGLELSPSQFETCKRTNGQFCHISTPFQPLANLQKCIATLYAKKQGQHRIQMLSTATQGFNNPSPHSNHTRCLDTCNPYFSTYSHSKSHMPQLAYGDNPRSTTTTYIKTTNVLQCHFSKFLSPPRYETPVLNVNVSLDRANIRAINIMALHFHVWQHMGSNCGNLDLQHLAVLPSIPVHQIYEHLLNNSQCLTPFNMKSSEDSHIFWNLFSHPGIYVSALGSVLPVGVILFCFYYFWCLPAMLVH